MKRSYLHIAYLVLIAFMAISMEAVGAQRIIKINNLNDINLCETDNKMFTFDVNIGEIKKSDNFVGYDLWLRYDSSKVTILSYLPMNSLTEFFSSGTDGLLVGMNKYPIEGTSLVSLRMHATTFGNCVYGNRHLIAFQGIISSKIENDSIPIEFEYIDIDDSDVFRNEEKIYINDTIRVYRGKNIGSYLDATFSDKNIIGEDLKELLINAKYSIGKEKVDKFEFTITNNNANCCYIDKIESTDNFEISDVTDDGFNNFFIRGNFKNMANVSNKDLVKIKLIFINEIKDSVLITVTPEYKNDCFEKISGGSIQIKNNLSSDIEADMGISFKQSADFIEINNKGNILSVDVIDILGNNYYSKKNEYIVIPIKQLPNGVYFVNIQNSKNNLIKKIKVNN